MRRKLADDQTARGVLRDYYSTNGIPGASGSGAASPSSPFGNAVRTGGLLGDQSGGISNDPMGGGAPGLKPNSSFGGLVGASEQPLPMVGRQPGMFQGGSGQQPPMAQGAMPQTFNSAGSPLAAAAPKVSVYEQYKAIADRFAQAGLGDKARQYSELAEKYRPKYSTTPQVVKDPKTGKLIQVLVGEDGTTTVMPYGVKPDIQIEDLGGSKRVIDRNEVSAGTDFKKTMTPGEVASNGLGWANNSLSRERLAMDRNQPEYREVNGELVAIPKTFGPGGAAPVGQVVRGADGQPVGGQKSLTEFQGKSTTYATRMQDASKVLNELEGKVWPSTVARAGYRTELPNWLPGGQPLGAGITALNQLVTPADAQRYHQAQENWVTANLRQESGAAIGKDEMAKDIRKWFRQPGESDEVATQKADSRRVTEQAMTAQAGPGAKQIPEIMKRAEAAQPSKPLELPSNLRADALKRGATYTLPNGKTAVWDGFQFKGGK